METKQQLTLNRIKTRLQRSQPIASEDINWLIANLENMDFELQRITAKHNTLKEAINRSQMLAIDANDRVKKVCGNDK